MGDIIFKAEGHYQMLNEIGPYASREAFDNGVDELQTGDAVYIFMRDLKWERFEVMGRDHAVVWLLSDIVHVPGKIQVLGRRASGEFEESTTQWWLTNVYQNMIPEPLRGYVRITVPTVGEVFGDERDLYSADLDIYLDDHKRFKAMESRKGRIAMTSNDIPMSWWLKNIGGRSGLQRAYVSRMGYLGLDNPHLSTIGVRPLIEYWIHK